MEFTLSYVFICFVSILSPIRDLVMTLARRTLKLGTGEQ